MGKGVIGIVLKDGGIAVKINMEKLSQGELAMLVTNLEILKQRLISDYKKAVKAFDEDVKNGQ